MSVVSGVASPLNLVGRTLTMLAAIGTCGCTVESNPSLLAKFKLATCLAYGTDTGHTRFWDATVSLQNGSKVWVRAAGAGGENWVVVSYPETGSEVVAAKPYDYIYPTDIRIDSHTDVLYVAAHGFGAGIWEETWLFAFDLREGRQTANLRIDGRSLPEECPGGQ